MNIVLIDLQGGIPRRLTAGTEEYLPTWSRDGNSVYYVSIVDGLPNIYSIPESGAEPRQVTQSGGVQALESEDRRHLFLMTHQQSRRGPIWRRLLTGGEDSPRRYWTALHELGSLGRGQPWRWWIRAPWNRRSWRGQARKLSQVEGSPSRPMVGELSLVIVGCG